MKKKIHLVSSDVVCSSKEKGGLGIRRLSIVNRALLGKWVWRFAKEHSIRKEVIRLKYQVEQGGWFTKIPRGSGGVGLWKDISKENQQLKLDSSFLLGNRRRICFWEDRRCGEGALSVEFPTLYNLADPKGARVADVWDKGRGEGAWNSNFIKTPKQLGGSAFFKPVV